MAENVVASGCPSCSKLKEKCAKMVENRNALRQAVKLMENGFEELQKKYDQLQRDCQEAQKQARLEKEAKDKELVARSTIEKELLVVKGQLSKYQQKESSSSGIQDQNRMLNSCISEKEAEIKRLEDLLVNEKKRVDSEHKKAEIEKKKVEEERKLLEIQKKIADDQRNKASKFAIDIDKLKVQLTEVSRKLEEEKSKVSNLEASIAEETQKTIKEKIRADREMEKVNDLKKALEERKKIRDKKVNTDKLKEQLENEKQKREMLEKKLLELNSPSGRTSSDDQILENLLNGEKSRVKLLQGRLELEKEHARLARRKAKLEKAEKLFIRKQFHLLKQDHMELSYQLMMLGDQVSQRITGTHSLSKHLDLCQKCSKENLQRSHSCICSCYKMKDTQFTTSGCSCIRLMPGTGVEFEYPSIGSMQKRLQNSAVCSTLTTPDVEIRSSQLQDVAMANTSSFADSLLRQSVSKVHDESAQNTQVEKLVNETDAKDILRSMKDVYANTCSGGDQNGSTCSVRRKTIIAGAKAQSSKSSRQRQENKHEELQIINHPNKRRRFENESIGLPCFSPKPLLLSDLAGRSLNMYDKQPNVVGEQPGLLCAETMSLQDCMKLLELDNSEDESRFREAIERPLTPTLPDIELLNLRSFEADGFHNLVGEFSKTTDNVEFSCAFDVIELEISSNESAIKIPVAHDVMQDNSSYLFDHEAVKSKLSNVLLSHRASCGHKALPDISTTVDDQNVVMKVANVCPESNTQTKISSVEVSHHTSEEHNLPDNSLLNEGLSSQVDGDSDAFTRNNESSSKSGDNQNVVIKNSDINPDTNAETKIYTVEVSHRTSEELNLLDNSFLDGGLSSQIDGDGDVFIRNSESSSKPERADKAQESDYLLNIDPINIQFTYGGQEENGSTVASINHKSHPYSETRKSVELETASPCSGKSSETRIANIINSTSVSESNKYMSLSVMVELEHQSGKAKETPFNFVVFSDNNNSDSISRIVQTSSSITSTVESEKDCLVVKALHGLALEVDLHPEERVCVFFSLLLNGICDTAMANFKNVVVGDILLYAKSFAADITRVFSDVTTKWLFMDVCQLDILMNLIEDFLVSRKVLICNDHVSDKSCSLFSSESCLLKGESFSLTETAARVGQLIIAGVLLGSISILLDQIAILIEASYKVLRHCKTDVFSNLLVLHMFSFVCGEELLGAEKHLSAIAIKELVSVLEKGLHVPQFLPSPKFLSDENMCFPPCKECPFSRNICGMDTFVCFLMDVLEGITSNGSLALSNLESSCIWKGPGKKCYHTVCQKINAGNKDDAVIQCDTSCMLYKYSKQITDMSDWTPQKNFCYFTNVVSMLELFACYMSWERTSSIIVPRLLKMLQSCPDDDLSAGLIVLIGQIARFAVDFVGYGDVGVAELRHTLLNFLDNDLNEKSSCCKQLALFGSLVNLLPVTFKEIVDGHIEDSPDVNPSQMKLIKDWFMQLQAEHQVLVQGLFK